MPARHLPLWLWLASALLLAASSLSSSVWAGAARDEWLYSCGGPGYPLSVFDQPPGAERAPTPQARALRRLLEHPRGIEKLPRHGWRLAAERRNSATFTGRKPWRRRGMFEVTFKHAASGRYTYESSTHYCAPQPYVKGNRVGSWELDPDFDAPEPEATEIHVLVHGVYCASGEPPLERIRPPMISYGQRRLVIATVEAPPRGFQTCEDTPASEYTFELAEPIGRRILFDGEHLPFHKRLDLTPKR